MMEEQPKKSNGVMWAVVVVVLGLIAYGAYAYTQKNSSPTSNEPAVIPPSMVLDDYPNPTDPNEQVSAGVYKDGTYTSLGNYNSPGGAEQIRVTLILENDVIKDANVVSLATLPTSKTMQAKFISGYKALVIGKKLNEVELTKVSGSSLTPKGWNDAVAKITVEAQS